MIHALPARYPQREAIEDMAPWDKAYTKEMRKVFEAYPDDLEVRAVFAESIMNETPWDMWDLPSGKTAEGAGTEECRAVLEYAFGVYPGFMGSPRPPASLCPLDGDVTFPATGAVCGRPATRDRCRTWVT